VLIDKLTPASSSDTFAPIQPLPVLSKSSLTSKPPAPWVNDQLVITSASSKVVRLLVTVTAIFTYL